MLPQTTVVPISGAGHALHFDQPEAFASGVRSVSAQPGVRPDGATS